MDCPDNWASTGEAVGPHAGRSERQTIGLSIRPKPNAQHAGIGTPSAQRLASSPNFFCKAVKSS